VRALPSSFRKQLETGVLAARRAAESASRAAIDGLGVFVDRLPGHLGAEQAALRNGLRAKWRQLGHDRGLLVAECAYEQWHRLLFARFLAENHLLLHPKYRAPVTLADCDELAAELREPDGWAVAARFAADILPGIFRLDDPCVRLRLAPEGRHALEQILDGLPREAFVADDALGWVYQFWQKDKKDEINASERKIGGADLGPVTQLFTENYMVRFLLENSLGAWWTARHPNSQLVKGFEYLRFDDSGKPAAGRFDSWPDLVAEVTVIDPCCGSGHFLVEAFSMLWQMRAEEEDLSAVDAQDAVLRDNLFGLELDPRCVQIAMFAVALQAWKAGGGWRQLPIPNIACSGISVKAPADEWKKLARGDERLANALVRLHVLFRDADSLGSLIDPKRSAELIDPMGLQRSMEDVEWKGVAPALVAAAASESMGDIAASVVGANLTGLARSAALLANQFTLVSTNVPFLSRSKQAATLRDYLDLRSPLSKGDLATAMLERWLHASCTVALVSPQNWQEKPGYTEFRRLILKGWTYDLFARLGNNVWQTQSGRQPFKVPTLLSVLSSTMSSQHHFICALDIGNGPVVEKPRLLATTLIVSIPQHEQLSNPDSRIVVTTLGAYPTLESIATAKQGIKTGDDPRYRRTFWEVPSRHDDWAYFQSSVVDTHYYGGRSSVVFWEQGRGSLAESTRARIQGQEAWGRKGVLVSQMGDLFATLYTGELFDSNAAAVIPARTSDLTSLWAFLSSPDYRRSVRAIDNNVAVTNRTLVKVPFDADRWMEAADKAEDLPEPWSDDPRQWLFGGRPEVSTAALQVAVGRLVGYRWPEQSEHDDLDPLADADGIVSLPSVAGEAPAVNRLQQMLAIAFADAWSPAKAKELLEQDGSKKRDLADWLRDEFFRQHCALFGNRPFVWHIWDGQRDGFSALIDYQRLDRKLLEKLTYTYLGQDWVERQRAAVREEVPGAEARLSAAVDLRRKLEAILEGEKPYDIYVRWKELHEQPVGWEPDLNDGVRLNIRPFVTAGVLKTFSPWPFKETMWKKDRGKNPDGSERNNDTHLALADKIAARKRAGWA
jgi:hypothetical protein